MTSNRSDFYEGIEASSHLLTHERPATDTPSQLALNPAARLLLRRFARSPPRHVNTPLHPAPRPTCAPPLYPAPSKLKPATVANVDPDDGSLLAPPMLFTTAPS